VWVVYYQVLNLKTPEFDLSKFFLARNMFAAASALAMLCVLLYYNQNACVVKCRGPCYYMLTQLNTLSRTAGASRGEHGETRG
jgi:hypothetical protein